MKRLGLLGKNIAHSRSPIIYKELLSIPFMYELYDYATELEVPEIEEFFKGLDGINITAPYKKTFYNHVVLDDIAKKVGSINCIRKENGMFYGTNTDYAAFVSEYEKLTKVSDFQKVIILGDGAMSQMARTYLDENEISFELFSRKKDGDISELDFKSLYPNKNTLIINTCARGYVFSGELSEGSLFWDLNYNHMFHQRFFETRPDQYYDGNNFLLIQAEKAILFWGIK